MKEATKNALVSQLEAVLFASGEPISVTRLIQACDAGEDDVVGALQQLAQQYEARNSAICIQQLGQSWQMATHPAYADVVLRAIETKKQAPLSAAAMEVLTIVAYNQPVSKGFVEHVRGVDSSTVVNTLVEKELLMEVGRLDVPGKPIAYGTTPHFLRCFGLHSLEELPQIPMLLTEPVSEEADSEADIPEDNDPPQA